MIERDKIDEIRRYVSLSNVKKAFNLLMDIASENELGSSFSDELRLKLSHFNQNKKKHQLGLISKGNFDVELNNINFYILSVCTNLDKSKSEESTLPIIQLTKVDNLDVIQIKQFIKFLIERLKIIEIDEKWNPNDYTELSIKSLTFRENAYSVKFKSLFESIKKHNEIKASLLLGDPGSGKSIESRKLSMSLLKEWTLGSRIPIYVNLRNWKINIKQEEKLSKRININSFLNFVYTEVCTYRTAFVETFISKSFYSLYLRGDLFFIFDSFDEHPNVIDSKENSESIDGLSLDVFQFIGENKCLLVSRKFKKPTPKYLAEKIYHLEPLDDEKILSFYRNSLETRQIQKIFSNPTLKIISKNPLLASMIVKFYLEKKKLPQNQMDLFIGCILEDIKNHSIANYTHSYEDTVSTVIEMSKLMQFSTGFGLDAKLEDLSDKLNSSLIGDVCNFLVLIGLARIGQGRISLKHRRINEFFVALGYINEPHTIPINTISSNGENRDSLVLFAEIADAEYCQDIINDCITKFMVLRDEKIGGVLWGDEPSMEAVHAFRFLIEAFRSRKKLLEPVYEELREVILNISSGNNLILRKISIAGSVLLKVEDASEVINNNFIDYKSKIYQDSYLLEAVIEASRYLPKLDERLQRKMIAYYGNNISEQGFTTPFSLRKLIKFLEISDSFNDVQKYLKSLFFEQIIVSLFFWFLGGVVIYNFLTTDKTNFGNDENFIFFIITLMMLAVPFNYTVIPSISISFNYFKNKKRFKIIARRVLFLIFLFSCFGIYLEKTEVSVSSFLFESTVAGYLIWGVLIFSMAVFLFLIPSLIGYFISSIKNRKFNKIILESAKESFITEPTKENVNNWFYEFTHSGYRLDFVEFIKKEDIVPSGYWPTGDLPNVRDDGASILLAKLEEKWLKL